MLQELNASKKHNYLLKNLKKNEAVRSCFKLELNKITFPSPK
jgi:hypothetical protein